MLVQSGTCIAGRFEIVELAGSGGMGAVYRAVDRTSGELVALKLIRGDETSPSRFRREARILAELRHPGIVRYVDSGATEGGEPYLAMEWLNGETLEARLAREELTLADSVALVRRLADALGAAHAHGVIHRDIKPSNVFLVDGRPEQARLLDFGVARVLGVSLEMTRTGGVLGTLAYMAPEQACGEVDVDARADVFALGLVLYRLLAGRPAISADTPMAFMAKLIFEEPAPLSRLRPELPPALDDLVQRMLAKKKLARPASCAAIASALDALGDLSARADSGAATAASALTGRERRLVSVLLARLGVTLPSDSTVVTAKRAEGDELIDALRVHSSQLSWLADGTLVIVLDASGVATDLAVKAARCALELRQRHPHAPIVVATGRAELTALSHSGEVIDRAAALLGALDAAPAILIDDVTAGLLGDRFVVQSDPLGLLLAGENLPPADPPTGETRSAPSTAAAAALAAPGRRLPFLGRDRELNLLGALFDECASDAVARAALITAPAGTGKSRLAAELIDRLALRGERFELWRAQGDPMSGASPLAMLGACIRRAAGIFDGEPLEARHDKIRALVAQRLPENARRRVAEFLGEIVRAPFPDEGRPTLQQARKHAALMAEEMRRAWEELVEASCAAGPLVLLAEDVHWADGSSLKYLDAALRRLKRPFLLIALARPEVHELFPGLWAERGMTELKLHELRPRVAASLVRATLGPDLPDATAARIVDQAGGNAFYLEELIRAVAEGRSEALPDTILAMVQARLGALPPAARAVLRAASVFGEVFWRSGVEALLGGGEQAREVPAWLDFLEERDLIVHREPARFPRDREFTFRHALLRDGAYALLTDADRALGHRLAGAWLEAVGETDAMLLAEHYERGDDAERAARWCLTAAEQAFERDDRSHALTAARRGLEILRGAGGAVQTALERVEALAAAPGQDLSAAPTAPIAIPESSYRFWIVPGTRIFGELCVGRWSRDFTRQYIDDFKATLQPLLGRPWGKLCNLDAWLPTEPDAAESLIEFLKWSIEEKMTFVAYVISNPSARLQARRIIESSSVDMMAGFFATEEEGLAWLKQSGLDGESA